MVVLIFGLISSTFLVVTVFPYYYLGAEFLRLRINPRHFLIWLAVTTLLAVLAGIWLGALWVLLVVVASLLVVPIQRLYLKVLS